MLPSPLILAYCWCSGPAAGFRGDTRAAERGNGPLATGHVSIAGRPVGACEFISAEDEKLSRHWSDGTCPDTTTIHP